MAKKYSRTFKTAKFEVAQFDDFARWTIEFENGTKRFSRTTFPTPEEASRAIGRYIERCEEQAAKGLRFWVVNRIMLDSGRVHEVFTDAV